MVSPSRLAFYFNAALLSIHMNKPDQCKEVLGSLALTLSLSLSLTLTVVHSYPYPYP